MEMAVVIMAVIMVGVFVVLFLLLVVGTARDEQRACEQNMHKRRTTLSIVDNVYVRLLQRVRYIRRNVPMHG